MTDLQKLYECNNADDFAETASNIAEEIRNEPLTDANGAVRRLFKMSWASAHILVLYKCVFFIFQELKQLKQINFVKGGK